MEKERIKQVLDEYGMWYYHYLQFRAKFLPTKYQEEEKRRHTERVVFYSNFITANQLVFDIGANYGNRVDVFQELQAKVVAVEPQEHCIKYLKKKFKSKIRIVEKAISDEVGVAKLHSPKNKVSSASASLSKEWISAVVKSKRFEDKDWNVSRIVPTTTLDSLISEFGKPVFCKIDVEGSEIAVLKGLTQKLKALSFEFTTPEGKEQLIEGINILLEIDKHYQFNFCVGEELIFKMKSWLNGEGMIKEIKSNSIFRQQGIYGDIYCKN